MKFSNLYFKDIDEFASVIQRGYKCFKARKTLKGLQQQARKFQEKKMLEFKNLVRLKSYDSWSETKSQQKAKLEENDLKQKS